MTFEDWMKKQDPALIKDAFSAAAGWSAGQTAERERIKGRVKGAAESVWGIKDYFDGCSQYIGPSLNTLEEFVEKLMEEE